MDSLNKSLRAQELARGQARKALRKLERKGVVMSTGERAAWLRNYIRSLLRRG